MENNKHIGLMILVSVIVTFFGCIVTVRLLSGKKEIVSTITTPVVQESDLQDMVFSAYSSASEAIVDISISKDLKFYVEDPSQMTAPGSIQTKEAILGGASGIIISKEGYVLTNKHVVEDTKAKYQVTLHDGRIYQVEKIRLDPAFDLAVLQIVGNTGTSSGDLPVALFAPFDEQAQVGQFVLSIGNALTMYPNSVGFGIIAGKNRTLKINDKHTYVGLYQTDAKISLGNSGGPLVNLQGQVIGITTAVADSQGVGFALPISAEFVTSLVASIQTYQAIVRPLIGIEYVDVTPVLQMEKKLSVSEGIVVTSVLEGMPAKEAGLQKGDIVTAINDKPITTTHPFLYHIYTYTPGTTISLTVIRDGQTLKISVDLGQNAQ